MARYTGTSGNDIKTGLLLDPNIFDNYGIGQDKVTGGIYSDTFNLLVDERTDTIDGGKGVDRIDYSQSDRGLTIDLALGTVTAVFGGGATGPVHIGNVATLKNIEDVTGTIFV